MSLGQISRVVFFHFCMLESWVYPKRVSLASNWSQLFLLIFSSLMWWYLTSHRFSVPVYPAQGLFSFLCLHWMRGEDRQFCFGLLNVKCRLWFAILYISVPRGHLSLSITPFALKCYKTKQETRKVLWRMYRLKLCHVNWWCLGAKWIFSHVQMLLFIITCISAFIYLISPLESGPPNYKSVYSHTLHSAA